MRCASDVICFALSRLFRVATFRRAGFALSQADFYFKAWGDRLYSAVRRRVYYLNSRASWKPAAQKQDFAGIEEAKELRVCNFAICQLAIFFIKNTITRQEIQIRTVLCFTDCQRLTEKKNRIFAKAIRFRLRFVMEIWACSRSSVKFIGVQEGFAKRCKSGLSRYPAAVNTKPPNTTGDWRFPNGAQKQLSIQRVISWNYLLSGGVRTIQRYYNISLWWDKDGEWHFLAGIWITKKKRERERERACLSYLSFIYTIYNLCLNCLGYTYFFNFKNRKREKENVACIYL